MSQRHDRQSLAKLTAEERVALFEQLQRLKKGQGSQASALIKRQSRASQLFPLSFAQQRLWFLEQFEPNTPLYNITQTFRMFGSLQREAFCRALESIVARHEVLRTVFVTVENEPKQMIVAHGAPSISFIDLRHVPAEMRETEALRLTSSEALSPFHLSQGPLLRAMVVQLAEEEYILLLTMHHIVSDGWSQGIFLSEFMQFYSAYLRKEMCTLPELPIQYVDFTLWQRERLQGQTLATLLDYWKRQLADLPILQLPTDHPRPPVRTIRGSYCVQECSLDVLARLKAISRQEDASLFMVLLAAFAIFLSHYTGSTDLPIGTSIANRNQAEIEKLIGFFVNTLVMRLDLSGNPTFQDLVKRVRDVCLEAYAHQDLPFEQLVDAMHPERDLSKPTPLVQVMFVVQNAPSTALEIPGLTLKTLALETRTSKFDLTVFVLEDEQTCVLDIEYNSDLFEETTIRRMLRHFLHVLETAATHPTQRIASFSLVTPDEYQKLVTVWNATNADYPQLCVHQLFEQQVARTPDAPALSTHGQSLTYQEVQVAANQLAHFLRAQGVGPDVLVAVCLERSFDLVIAILAILKAGGGYVPLDPTYPVERLSFILQDAHASILLTRRSLAALFLATDTPMMYLGEEDLSAESMKNPQSGVMLDHLAYVIYTSGSTGQPKGVMISHRGLTNYLSWAINAYHIDTSSATQGALLHSSISFDLTVTSLFAPLCVGQSIVLLPDDDKEVVRAALQSSGTFSLLKVTPAHLEMFYPSQDTQIAAEKVGSLVIGGEALLAKHQPFWQTFAPSTHIVNEYGPTETVVGCCVYEVAAHEQFSESVPIGRPIANMRIYLLDSSLHLLPIGMPGEISIGGVGLARGYMGRPDLTAERFLPNPFSPEPGARLYRTGDLARHLPSGDLTFLGRIDHQVKIRGYRIELGEIEAALQQHPAVQDVVVIARESLQAGINEASSEKRLFAYVIRRKFQQEMLQEAPTAWSQEQVKYWLQTFESSYREAVPLQDPTFDLAGWTSSYNGQALPEEEMHEWVNQTVERILAQHPSRILEIGCGTGLQLFRLAPVCEEYWGTDFSPVVLHNLQQSANERGMKNVKLLCREADDFSGPLGEQRDFFDVVIINSVVQYFPSMEYLLQVLKGALQLIKPGGMLFVGDVRDLRLLEAFHTSVQLRKVAVSLFTSQLRVLIQKQVASENELLLDPTFFFALQQHIPEISQVDVQLKRGLAQNELTRFRYDVCLYKQSGKSPLNVSIQLDWQQDQLTLQTLQHLLEEQPSDVVAIAHVPNARLLTELKVDSFLQHETTPREVRNLWSIMSANDQEKGLEPEDLWSLGERLGYHVSISPALDAGLLAFYNVLLIPLNLFAEKGNSVPPSYPHIVPENTTLWQNYANAPFRAEVTNNFLPELRSYLKQKLPDYMHPAAIIEVDAFPLSPNGKIDHRALPTAEGARPTLQNAFVAPRTHVEKKLAEIWSQVLGIELIGIHDKFFDLGGDSLLTVRVVMKAHQAGLSITVKQLFQHQTIAELAAVTNSVHILAEQGIVIGSLPLMPAHRGTLGKEMGDPSSHSIAYIIETTMSFDAARMEQVVRHLLSYHDALRIRATQTAHGWELYNAGLDPTLPLQVIDLAHLPEVEQVSAVMEVATRLVLHFDLATEPLLRVALCQFGPGKPASLVVVGHSLVVDLQSWQILLEDLKTAYVQLRDQGAIRFPPKTTSYRQWANRLAEYTQSEQIQTELSYWLNASRQRVEPLPMDYPSGVNDGASMRVLLEMLSIEETTMLKREVARRKDLQMDAVFLTAVVQTFMQWSRQSTLAITIDGYGRDPLFEDIDLSHTLGTLAMDFPLFLDLEGATTPQRVLQAVHEQLRQVPNRGIGYGALRYMSNNRAIVEQLEALPKPEIFYNYIGTLIVPEVDEFKVAGPIHGRASTMKQIENLPAPLMVMGMLDGGQFQVTWYYSVNQYRPETVEHLAQTTMEKLRDLIALFLNIPEEG